MAYLENGTLPAVPGAEQEDLYSAVSEWCRIHDGVYLP
jgi:hypothetical protein